MEKLQKQDLLRLKKNKEKNKPVHFAENQKQKGQRKGYGNAGSAGKNLLQELFILGECDLDNYKNYKLMNEIW